MEEAKGLRLRLAALVGDQMLKKLLGKMGLTASVPNLSKEGVVVKGYITPQSAEQLLSTELRQAWLNHIWQHTSLSHEQFERIYLKPIKNYATLVQQFPASESHHHAYLGGLLDHGLELVGHALKIRQGYLLPPGVPPEDQAVQSDAWTAAIAYAGLLHDLGKIAVDIEVELEDGSCWHPWLGVITQPYRFRYVHNRDYQLHDKMTALLCPQIISHDSLNWLCQYPELWSNFIHLMAGDYEQAGLLGEIVDKADRISTAKSIGANPEKAMAAPVNSLQKKLITGLKHLIKTQLNLNKTPGNGWLTPDGLWLMSKTTADGLRAYLLSQGFDGIPTKNSILFDELQAHQIILTNPLDDRAIWTVSVSDESGQWQQEFSLIKVNAGLIWSNQEKPEYFKGRVEVIQKAVSDITVQSDDQEYQGIESPSAIMTDDSMEDFFNLNALDTNTAGSLTKKQKPSPVSVITSSKKTATQLVETANTDDTDDILALFGNEFGTADKDTSDNQAKALSTTTEMTTITNHTASDNHLEENLNNLFNFGDEVVVEPSNNLPLPPIDKTHAAVHDLAVKNNKKLCFDLKVELTKTTLGEYFITWLKHRISLHRLQINDKEAKLHLVNDQLFIVSPGIFQRFYFEHPELIALIKGTQKEPWQVIQSSFEKLKLHMKRQDELNIWHCAVTGPRKKGQVLKGYLLEARLFFTDFMPNNNPFISLQTEDVSK